jgi:uncharacterized protein (DUF4415 family)
MSNNSDPIFEQYADIDFSNAKPVADIPHLTKLQAEHGGKSRISILVDNVTLAVFMAKAEITGSNYQILINEALREFAKPRQS